jgi:hypothetical protein
VRRVARTTQKCGRRPSFKGRFLSPRAKHKSSNSQLPHHRELKTDDDATVLVAATVSGGGLYAFAIGATVEQWAASEAAIRAAHKSFSVAATEESSMDLSERIYSACIESGRKAAPLSLGFKWRFHSRPGQLRPLPCIMALVPGASRLFSSRFDCGERAVCGWRSLAEGWGL